MNLHEELATLPSGLRDHLAARGFEPAQLEAWAATIGEDRDRRNRLAGTVEPPYPGDLADVPAEGTAAYEEARARGQAALDRGEVALCLLAGGMATRMGGVVKALVDALSGHTFLDLRLGENAHVSRVAGARVPLWMMTSEATEGPTRAALGDRHDPEHLTTFEQHVSLRLTPEGRLFRDEHGEPSVYSTGHGDLPDALRQSGLLQRFRARGGKTVWIANIDNLGATVDAAVLGLHLAQARPVTVELVDKVDRDKGGGPVRWNGRPLITEMFRLPVDFDASAVPVFNTNTFLVDAAALASLSMEWTYVEVEKKIGAHTAVQFERILGELTATLEPCFLRVPRAGTISRFLPVKDVAELTKRRPEIELIARARGMNPVKGRLRAALGYLACVAGIAAPALTNAAPPPASTPVPDPGKGITNADDTSAIALNPANLAFLPGAEVRWGLVWTGATSTVPDRGTSFAAGVPIGPFATGLRLDLLYPPGAAPAPFLASSRWLRWALAVGNAEASFGTTFGWGFSSLPALDGYASVTSGVTWRPFPSLSASFEARDWNEPTSKGGVQIERSWVWGLGGRPLRSRVLEAAWDLAYYERSRAFGGHGMVAVDVPRVGRVRGDVTMLPEAGRQFVATAGVEVNVDRFQALAGGVFGNAVSSQGSGFYLGAAYRTFREPGLRLPARVVRIRIHDTPGVRGNTRLLRRLWRLADDPEVEGVVLELRGEPASSLAHAEEVANAVRLLRARGKKVMCHLEDNGGKSLFVCSQADRIAMNPAGGLRFAGLASSYYYLGGLLKKLGVRADFVRIGAHKLAAEQLSLERGSDVAELDHQELVDELEKIYLHDIGAGRGIPEAELKQRIAKGPFVASEARAAGLVDSLAYNDEIERWAKEVMGRPVRIVDDNPPPRAPDHWSRAPKVALIYLHGDMIDGDSKYVPFIDIRLAGSYTIARALKRAREDDSVKSVVFRIETGGGSSLAADVILREAILTAQKKPLIVSMGTSAASGGYYASVGGREIFANRGTVTGSIGIFYGKADVAGLLDKLGVRMEQFRSAPRADAESFYRPFTDDERHELGVKVKQFYDVFVARVAEGRHMTPEAVDAVARGKVWTGQQAIGKGLVDKLGGLREALAEARRAGRLPEGSPIVELPEDDESLLGFLLDLVGFHFAMGEGSGLPAALLPLAQVLAPFLVFEPNRPLARAEICEETTERGMEPKE